ncbi:hypothetical protein BIV57_13415 [Mangrovactinospora gilvigrisea]|uniref:HTH cro/C1-type domain-containing protein n=1 Tax=Mangrovactinospora gilvigrisea TaxID=1428644 RepID=A0A1J7BEI0_9ACTN|nr:helix-turn-helix transcriptional regulator [Mangrovactinospora gilvigrisea]OIV36981.1 hypothetical protein BIV57_13415 [Mangrovactinospora gilvigrisea]
MGSRGVRGFSAQLLRERRTALQLSQHALGARIGKDRHAVIRYEMGRHLPEPRSLFALARELGVLPTDLLDRPVHDLSWMRLRAGFEQSDVVPHVEGYPMLELGRVALQPDVADTLAGLFSSDSFQVTTPAVYAAHQAIRIVRGRGPASDPSRASAMPQRLR